MNDELQEIIEKEKQQGRAVFGQGIKTNVRLDHAGAMQRLFAYLLDSAITLFIYLLFVDEIREVTVMRDALGEQILDHSYVADVSTWYYFIIFILMRVLFEASPLQASPGKLLFFTKVTDEDGEGVGLLKLIIREIGCFFIPFTWIFYFYGEKRQCIHDKLAATFVVKRNFYSDILFFPAVILALALTALSAFYGISKIISDTPTVEPYQDYQQINQVSQISKEEALENAIIPDDDKLGSIKIDGEEVTLNTVFVRLKSNVKYTSFGELKNQGKVLEVAFYEDELNAEKLKRLNNVSNLVSNSKTVVKKNPVLFLSVQSDNFDNDCKNLIFKDSDLIINSDYFSGIFKENKTIKLRIADMVLNHFFLMNCDAVTAGNELFLSMQTPIRIGENSEGVVNVRFTEKIRELKYVGGYVYRHSNPKLVLAVYNKEQKHMRIAFYNEAYSKESLNTAYVKGILPTTPAPSFVLDIPVNGQLYGSGRDIVAKGYTMTFKNLPDEIGKEMAHRDYQIKFAAGETPARFVVQSPHAPQVQGRLEGVKEISSSAGITNLAWNVSFNARLILIKR